MFSIKGIFKNNKLHLIEPLNIKRKANVIITILDDEELSDQGTSLGDTVSIEDAEGIADDLPLGDIDTDQPLEDEEFSEEYYAKIRKHKRYIANGNISLIDGEKEVVYPLFDYSAGGLSFISNRAFEVGVSLTASIKDPIEQDTSVLDFEFEVARVVDYNGKYKVGCKFFDEVDEEIWHSLMS
ncbi:MAG: PilZ domain-containing protein [Proteobacteria bacterium]|nr:PilZ domain-containing protein [Pseudomonadota bacterium]